MNGGLRLYVDLWRQRRMAARRDVMYEKNRYAEVLIGIGVAFWMAYLLFFGTMLGFDLDWGAREAYQVIDRGLIFFLFADFCLRFMAQPAPSGQVKPYLLLPIRRGRLLHFMLLRAAFSWFNLIWLPFFVPFAILTITPYYGTMGVLAYVVGVWLLFEVNNFWLLLCVMLRNRHAAWLLLPVVVYALLAILLFTDHGGPIYDGGMELGEALINQRLWAFAVLLLVIVLLWGLCLRTMRVLVYNEVSEEKREETRKRVGREYAFLDRVGDVGEYVRLEIRLFLRNRACRQQLIMGVSVVAAYSLLIVFAHFESLALVDLLLTYDFVLFGLVFLSQLMSYEGNYIDGLMTRRESIYTLLRAKYLLYVVALLLPALLTLPLALSGKALWTSWIGWTLFTAGPVYFCLFQTAVYNKMTLDPNAKLTAMKGSGQAWQYLLAGLAFAVPMVLSYILRTALGMPMAGWVMASIGVLFIATSNLWLRNVYRRFMKRRYMNMEGFRNRT